MPEITIRDIASRVGVSVSTVSRAINNNPDINQKTKDEILHVIEETGYIPNNNARNLKRTYSRCVAVLVKGITNLFFSKMISVLESSIQLFGYAMVLRHVGETEDEVNIATELELEKRVCGVIFLGGNYENFSERVSKLNVPSILVGIMAEEAGKKYSCITIDDKLESRKMTDYLLDLGHRDITFITEPFTYPLARLRTEGFLSAFKERGLSAPKRIAYIDESFDHYSLLNGYLTIKKFLESGEKPTAIFGSSDMLAIGACHAVHEFGLKIPEDISVVGFDGIEIGEYFYPALTTIRQPAEEMAKQVAKLLFNVIDGGEHRLVVFSGELVERQSVSALRKC